MSSSTTKFRKYLTNFLVYPLAMILATATVVNPLGANASGNGCSDPSRQAGQFGGGSGIVADPFIVCDPQGLISIGSSPTSLSRSYRLGADIDLNNVQPVPDGTGLFFITGVFTGTFDGNYRSISNLRITSSTAATASLFRELSPTSTVEKLAIRNAVIELSRSSQNFTSAGTLARFAHAATVKEVWIDRANIGGTLAQGGILFGDSLRNRPGGDTNIYVLNLEQIVITNSTLTSDTTVTTNLGAIAGTTGPVSMRRIFVDSQTTIQTSSTATAPANSGVAGLFGSHSQANMGLTPTTVISQTQVEARVRIDKSTSTTNSSVSLAGFVGTADSSGTLLIRDSVFAGSLWWVDDASRVRAIAAGFVARNGSSGVPPHSLRNLLMVGDLTTNMGSPASTVQAFIGRAPLGVTESYYRPATNISNSQGGIAKSDEELRQLPTFPKPVEVAVAASGNGSAITYTTAANHGLFPRDRVSITGMNVSGFNLTDAVIDSTPTLTSFTVLNSEIGSSSGGMLLSGGWYSDQASNIFNWNSQGAPTLQGANPIWKINPSPNFPSLVWVDYWRGGTVSAPSNPTVTSSTPNSATLTWTPSTVNPQFSTLTQVSTAITGYVVQASTNNGLSWSTAIADTGPVTSAIVTGLAPGNSYTFRVRALVALSSTVFSISTAAIQTGANPSEPQNLSAVHLSENSFRISWDPPTNTGGVPITSYTLQVDKGNGFETVAHTGTSAEITGVSTNSLWSFRVLATNVVGSRSYAVYTNTPPVPYSGPIVTSFSTREVAADRTSSVTLDGLRLSQVTELFIGTTKLSFTRSPNDQLLVSLPALAKGVYDLRMVYSGGGVITHQAALTVVDAPVVLPSRTLLFTNFAGDGFRLPAAAARGIRSAVSSLGQASKIVCTGSTSGTRATASDRRLALRRAQEACDLAKRLVPGVVTEVRANPASGVGARFRNVTVTIFGN